MQIMAPSMIRISVADPQGEDAGFKLMGIKRVKDSDLKFVYK